ncbi:penicillin-binding protein 2 [Clostridium argentinense]|nr:penicillin-binding protein 2 [Clostridium argentinense]NFP50656.1 penicillin-binding protein 2 [Clostridium argentinense]NFP72396.1 penicillin-binding protein 2 [Clostridium argentinense]NFP75585.1 penicillin-binding protein 2 [Clostridium argentinense]
MYIIENITPHFSQKFKLKGGVFMRKKTYSFINYRWKEITINRIYIVAVLLICSFLVLLGRLYYIQYYKKETYSVMADMQYYYEENVRNINYKLLGRNNEELFDYQDKFFVVIDPTTFLTLNNDTSLQDIQTVTYILRNYNKDYDLSQMKYKDGSQKYTYEIDYKTYEKLNSSKSVNGIYTYKQKSAMKKKDWKIENLITSPQNYKDEKFKESESLEMAIYDRVKKNRFDKIRYEKDVNGKIIGEEIIIPEDNVNVKLTLDKNIQKLMEETLRSKDFNKYPQIGLTLVESESGKILSMAQKDDNISNINIGVPSSNGFLIGSVFKTIVFEAALDLELADLKDEYEIKNIFPKSIEKQKIYTLNQAYLRSSNDVFAQLGWKVGLDNIIKYAESQGLLHSVLNLHDEAQGAFEGLNEKDKSGVITNTSIGQTLKTTPLAVSAIPSTIVNKGIYVKPKILEGYVDNNGHTIEEMPVENYRVLSEETATIMEEQMREVITSEIGTGRKTNIEGVYMGGKTGTTEYFVDGKEYSDGWFVGYFKYKDEFYSMVIFIPEIDIVNDAGGTTAAYVFREAIDKLIKSNYL